MGIIKKSRIGDIFVILAALLVSAVLFLVFSPVFGAQGAARAEVYAGGALIRTLELKSGPYEALIETDSGVNRLLVERDGVRVISADCHSQTCVHTGKISGSGQVIACLPHRLIIKLAGPDGGSGVDAVAG